jgi:hypothetical protein
VDYTLISQLPLLAQKQTPKSLLFSKYPFFCSFKKAKKKRKEKKRTKQAQHI